MLRSVVATVAAGLDFTIDDIDDLRLVLDEACGQVLRLSRGAHALNLDIGLGERSLELTVSTDGDVSEPSERIQDSMAWKILVALADEVRLQDGRAPAISLSKSSRRA